MKTANHAQCLTVSHSKIRSTQQSHIQILILISLLGLAPVTTQCWAAEDAALNCQAASNSATANNATSSSSASAAAQAPAAEQPKIEWQIGPQKEPVAGVASLKTLKGECNLYFLSTQTLATVSYATDSYFNRQPDLPTFCYS